MIADFFEFLVGGAFDIFKAFLDLLPEFPFSSIDEIMGTVQAVQFLDTVVSWMNWLLPFNAASIVIGIWVTALMAYITVKLGWKYASVIRP